VGDSYREVYHQVGKLFRRANHKVSNSYLEAHVEAVARWSKVIIKPITRRTVIREPITRWVTVIMRQSQDR